MVLPEAENKLYAAMLHFEQIQKQKNEFKLYITEKVNKNPTKHDLALI